MAIYGYIRISSRKQIDGNSLEDQRQEILKEYKDTKIKIYEEVYSGAKDRKIFNEVINKLESGDTLVVTKLDRFCRTTKEGLEYIDRLMDKGVKIRILNMGLIEDSPMGRLIVTNLLAFAEFERALIIERTQAGLAVARTKEGFKEGRPKKHTEKQIKHILSMLAVNGGQYSYSELAELQGIGKATLTRYQAEYKHLLK